MTDKKLSRNQRRKQARAEAEALAPAQPTAGEIIRRRRNRRFLFVAVVVVALPVLEVISYQYRAITIVIANKAEVPLTRLKVTYPGGLFEAPELKAGASVTHVARPNFTFTREKFSMYELFLTFTTPDKGSIRQFARTGSIDYSARETYTVEPDPQDGKLVIKHTTDPGFPLSAIRDLFRSLGVR